MLLRVTDLGKIPSKLEGFPERSAGRITVHTLNREHQPWKVKGSKKKKEEKNQELKAQTDLRTLGI